MTEEEWLSATDPKPMLEFLRGQASDRKLILFCLYWCPLYKMERANGDPMYDTAMRYAEVKDNLDELRLAWGPSEYEDGVSLPEVPIDWAFHVTDPFFRESLQTPLPSDSPPVLRDIFGNPFRPMTFNPAWLTSTVVALARGIYDARDFSAMPSLADVLQDAGCHNDDILTHCRGDGPHVRGCWVVDAVLGKE